MDNIGLDLWNYRSEILDDNGPFHFIKSYRGILEELVLRYRSYVQNGTLMAILSNATHVKMYITNKFATFEYTRKLEDKENAKG